MQFQTRSKLQINKTFDAEKALIFRQIITKGGAKLKMMNGVMKFGKKCRNLAKSALQKMVKTQLYNAKITFVNNNDTKSGLFTDNTTLNNVYTRLIKWTGYRF